MCIISDWCEHKFVYKFNNWMWFATLHLNEPVQHFPSLYLNFLDDLSDLVSPLLKLELSVRVNLTGPTASPSVVLVV